MFIISFHNHDLLNIQGDRSATRAFCVIEQEMEDMLFQNALELGIWPVLANFKCATEIQVHFRLEFPSNPVRSTQPACAHAYSITAFCTFNQTWMANRCLRLYRQPLHGRAGRNRKTKVQLSPRMSHCLGWHMKHGTTKSTTHSQ
jgi:hypothetical protein